jgi:hypothetical protein
VGCDGPQREQEDSAGVNRLIDEPMDQFCSSCNQKKPPIDFGRFLIHNIY